MNNNIIELRILDSHNNNDQKSLQVVLESAPQYSKNISGNLASPTAAEEAFLALPENFSPKNKYVLGVYLNNEIIGCIDVLRGFPSLPTAMLGLLLLKESHQQKGLGKVAYQHLEQFIANWPEIQKVRIGVIKSNERVLDFWKKMGFKDTGIRSPYKNGLVQSENLVFEKTLY